MTRGEHILFAVKARMIAADLGAAEKPPASVLRRFVDKIRNTDFSEMKRAPIPSVRLQATRCEAIQCSIFAAEAKSEPLVRLLARIAAARFAVVDGDDGAPPQTG